MALTNAERQAAFKARRAEMLETYADRLRADGIDALAEEAAVLCWEEHIEEAWATRNLRYLRGMVRHGLTSRRYRASTNPYICKSLLPIWFVQCMIRNQKIRAPRNSLIKTDH